ncbi:peroxiredoxin [Aureimonas flava]|uniref:Peroxiredoxin n=1 Tax=Aureimonas flava TaxID=2320271 RepID=A0A3A1WLP7_9HYPH|nr:peroxiredoxin [Aureimonas flava]RIY01328.1 peroxiredoxin [Aureimonas flava]
MTDLSTPPEGLEPPVDDGAASHLAGRRLPAVALSSTAGGQVDLSRTRGLVVVYAYPMTGRPGAPLPGGWNEIPGARGCTPQACSFRDHWQELRELGVSAVFGVSTQTTAYQREAAERLRLPFPLLSDAALELQEMLELPTFEADGDTLLKRLTMIAQDGEIVAALYPVFPPDRSAADVVDWLRQRRSPAGGRRH